MVEVPNEVVAALGGKGRIPVQASFDGVPYRGSIVKMGGVMMLGVTKAIMAEARRRARRRPRRRGPERRGPTRGRGAAGAGAALKRNRAAAAVWDKLSFSHRREYVGYIVEAKKEETRARRVERTIEALADRAAE